MRLMLGLVLLIKREDGKKTGAQAMPVGYGRA